MKIKELEKQIGTLSNPSKMPSFAWGISAKKCITGSKFVNQKNTVCSNCYALKHCYVFPNTIAMQELRYSGLGLPEWVDYMAELITQKYKNLDKSRLFHRWFDSGDLQSYKHLIKIFKVCMLTPHIKHWVATREYKIISKIKYKDMPKNLIIRVSTIKFDKTPPKFWKWTSGVHKDKKPIGRECLSYIKSNECGSCRACWDHRVKHISYKEH